MRFTKKKEKKKKKWRSQGGNREPYYTIPANKRNYVNHRYSGRGGGVNNKDIGLILKSHPHPPCPQTGGGGGGERKQKETTDID